MTTQVQAISHTKAPFTDVFLPGPVDGMQIHVTYSGNPATATRATIAIHGIYQTLDCWQRQQMLATDEHVFISLDLPYHGATTLLPSPPTSAIWSQSIRAVLEYFHLQEIPHILMGWSFGVWCIQQYLIRYGLAHVEGLVFVSGLIGNVQEYFPTIQQETLETLSTLAEASEASEVIRATQKFVTLLRKHYPDHRAYDETLGWNIRSVFKMVQLKLNPFAIIGATDPTEIKRVSAEIIAAGLPVLLMVGKQDNILPIATLPIALNAFPHAKVVKFEDCGHMCFQEYPEQFNTEIRIFRELIG